MFSFSEDNFAVAHEQLRIQLYLRPCYVKADLSTRDTRERSVLSLSLLILTIAENISRRKWTAFVSVGKWYYKSIGVACSGMKGVFVARLHSHSEDAQSFKDAPFDGSRGERIRFAF